MNLKILTVLGFLLILLASGGVVSAQSSADHVPFTGFDRMVSELLPEDGFAVYRWREFPDVFIIHFENYLLQGQTVNRMATYLEKVGMRGKVVSWPKLQTYLRQNRYSMENLYSAHDYRTSDLAVFFNALATAGEDLNDMEQVFLDLLSAQKLLEFDPVIGTWSSTGDQAVLSIASRYLGRERPSSQVMGQSDRTFEAHSLYHESRHGLYFTEPEYAQSCRDYWFNILSFDDRRAMRLVLWANNYDPADEELMINEWQAYVLTPPFEFIGVTALSGTLRNIASRRWIPKGLSHSDMMFIDRYGYGLADNLDDWMAADLRKWLGPQWDLPSAGAVASFKMKY